MAMARPVARWLDTFMCGHYAETFERYGYKTLQSVCQLDVHQLRSMGIRPEHEEKIMENVSVLQQSYMAGNFGESPGPHHPSVRNNYSNNMPTNKFPSGNQMINQPTGPQISSYADQQDYYDHGRIRPMWSPPPQGYSMYNMRQNMNQGGQQHQSIPPPYNEGQFPQPDQRNPPMIMRPPGQEQLRPTFLPRPPDTQEPVNIGHNQQTPLNQFQQINPDVNPKQRPPGQSLRPHANYVPNSNLPYTGEQGQSTGTPTGNQSIYETGRLGPRHPHLRDSSQNPQQVADTILQMATTNFSGSQNVNQFRPMMPNAQVPLHSPQRRQISPSNPFIGPRSHQAVGNQMVMNGPLPLPNASPLSPMQMCSPSSVQSNVSTHSSSPGPLQSPLAPGVQHTHSPGMVNMRSPGGIQTPTSMNQNHNLQSPVHTMHNVSISPVNPNDQLSPPLRAGSSSSICSPNQALPSKAPHSDDMYNHDNRCSKVLTVSTNSSPSHYSTCSQPSQGAYIQDNSKFSENLGRFQDNQMFQSDNERCAPKSNFPTMSCHISPNTQEVSINPLQSLQRLVMLPESQVIDPKSVVNDACLPNMSDGESSKNLNDESGSQANKDQCLDSSIAEGLSDCKTELPSSPYRQVSHVISSANNIIDNSELEDCNQNNYMKKPRNITSSFQNEHSGSQHSANDTIQNMAGNQHCKELHKKKGDKKKKKNPDKTSINNDCFDDDFATKAMSPIKSPRKILQTSNSLIDILNEDINQQPVDSGIACLERHCKIDDHYTEENKSEDLTRSQKQLDQRINTDAEPCDLKGVSLNDKISTLQSGEVNPANIFGGQKSVSEPEGIPVPQNEAIENKLSVEEPTSTINQETPPKECAGQNNDQSNLIELSEDVTQNSTTEQQHKKISTEDSSTSNQNLSSEEREILKQYILEDDPGKADFHAHPALNISKIDSKQDVAKSLPEVKIETSLVEESNQLESIDKTDESSDTKEKDLDIATESYENTTKVKESFPNKSWASDRSEKECENTIGKKEANSDKIIIFDTENSKGLHMPTEISNNESGCKKFKISHFVAPENKLCSDSLQVTPEKRRKKHSGETSSSVSDDSLNKDDVLLTTSELTDGTKDVPFSGKKRRKRRSAVKKSRSFSDGISEDNACENATDQIKRIAVQEVSGVQNISKVSEKNIHTESFISHDTKITKETSEPNGDMSDSGENVSIISAKSPKKDIGQLGRNFLQVENRKCDVNLNKHKDKFSRSPSQSGHIIQYRSSDSSDCMVVDEENRSFNDANSPISVIIPSDSRSNSPRAKKKLGNQTYKKKKRGSKKVHSTLSLSMSDSENDTSYGRLDLKNAIRVAKSKTLLKKSSKKEDGAYVGPVVRIKGSKESPNLVEIVNSHDTGDHDKVSKGKGKHVEVQSERSNNSLTYPMSDTVPWNCAFCGKSTNYSILGDLFGPYFLENVNNNPSLSSPNPFLEDSETSKNKGKTQKKNRCSGRESKRRRWASKEAMLHSPTGKAHTSSATDLPYEVWFHEDCVTWCHGVYLASSKVHGLDDAVAIAKQTTCSVCHRNGATLGCFIKGCLMKYHYLCAVEKDCSFDEENFSLVCPKHKERKVKMLALT